MDGAKILSGDHSTSVILRKIKYIMGPTEMASIAMRVSHADEGVIKVCFSSLVAHFDEPVKKAETQKRKKKDKFSAVQLTLHSFHCL